jgi:hypothetical protein
MKLRYFLSITLTATAGCGVPSLTSIDGLEGGALTTALTAPSVTASVQLSAPRLDVTEEVTSPKIVAADITTTSVNTASVVLQRGTVRVGLTGLIVGTAVRGAEQGNAREGPDAGTSPNFAIRQAQCATAFPANDELPAAHVCTIQEALNHALQAPESVPPDATGALVHTYAHFVYAPDDVDGSTLTVNDSGGLQFVDFGATSHGFALFRRVAGDWTVKITTQPSTRLACCQ